MSELPRRREQPPERGRVRQRMGLVGRLWLGDLVVASPAMPPRRQSADRPSVAILRITLGAALLASCESPSVGVDPPEDQIFFPSGMVMDPRTPDPPPSAAVDPTRRQSGMTEGGRWLFLTNANRDVSYNAGSVVAIDLDAFWDAWFDPETKRAYPYCDPENREPRRCVQPVGAEVNEDFPCRHLAVEPQVVECDESNFVKAAVRIGNFGTDLGISPEVDADGDPFWRLWTPVRADPSISYIDMRIRGSGEDERIEFDCGQGEGSGERDPLMCDRDYRLTHKYNDENQPRLTREPFSLLIDPVNRFGFVAHAAGGALTIFELGDARKPPAIIEQVDMFTATQSAPGGFGLAIRPCFEAGEGPLGPADPDPNVPTITKGCSRPLIYAGYRFSRQLVTFTVTDEGSVRAANLVPLGGLQVGDFLGPVLGQIHFAGTRGDELYAIQTTPGAFLQVDTSLGIDGEPVNSPAAPPIELCLQPTVFAIHDDGIERLAFVSCFRSATLFIVDLNSFEVVGSVLGGTGPHDLFVDGHREVLYSANTLEATLSVIDISRSRPTRFSEIARLGLQEAFAQ